MFSRRILAAIILLSTGVSLAIACGPFFPWQLFDNRVETFKAAPVNSFVFQAVKIAPSPTDKLKAIGSDAPDALPKAEAVGLSAAQSTLLQQIRTDATGDQAYQQGASLPESIRLYAGGAIDFHQKQLAKAQQRFEAVLKVPGSDQLRATWAAYMLGRIDALNGDPDQAAQEFQLTRQLAIHGAPDPLGLAVASYGEEARLHLNRAKSDLLQKDRRPKDCVADCRRELVAAISLYAEQAARDSTSGIDSLREVAKLLLQPIDQVRPYALLNATIEDPIVQKLVVAYGQAYFKTEGVDSPVSQNGGVCNSGLTDAAAHLAWPDQTAALAYQSGAYDLARILADRVHSPLASWVKAKLALQRYDLKAAAAFYAEASHGFPPTQLTHNLDDDNRKRLVGETGALALARGEYVQSLKYLYPVADTYWGDVAYIAERVLTSDELKNFIDANVPAPAIARSQDDQAQQGFIWNANKAARLRDLLARRLVREQRYADALPYFHSQQDKNFENPKVREDVTAYAQALHTAHHSWLRINRARGWYDAAVLARKSGMSMMGYETQPDYFVNSGGLVGGYGQENPGRSWVTDGELARFDASKPKVELRLHYRFIAANEAIQAADLLPPRSQAFAAVLCHATNWMKATAGIVKDQAPATVIADQLYQRYLKEGAYIPWGKQFGRICWHGQSHQGELLEPRSDCGCPEPDFESAARLPRALFIRQTRHFVSVHRWPLFFAGIVFLISAVGLVLRGHRRTA